MKLYESKHDCFVVSFFLEIFGFSDLSLSVNAERQFVIKSFITTFFGRMNFRLFHSLRVDSVRRFTFRLFGQKRHERIFLVLSVSEDEYWLSYL